MKDYLDKTRRSLRNGVEFVRETRKELRNVSWPSRRELTGTTIVVIVAVFFFGFYLFVVDTIVQPGINLIFRAAGR